MGRKTDSLGKVYVYECVLWMCWLCSYTHMYLEVHSSIAVHLKARRWHQDVFFPLFYFYFSLLFFLGKGSHWTGGVTMSATLVCQQVPGIFLSLLSPALGSQRRSGFNTSVRDLNSGLYARLSSPLPSDPSPQVWQCLFFSLNILCFLVFILRL